MSDDAANQMFDDDAQASANLHLAGRFIREALADAAILDAIPDGASIVLLPNDDSELERANRELARALAASGKAVHMRVVGGVISEPPLAVTRFAAIRLPVGRFRPEDLVAAISRLMT
jgi:hypothetical protein